MTVEPGICPVIFIFCPIAILQIPVSCAWIDRQMDRQTDGRMAQNQYVSPEGRGGDKYANSMQYSWFCQENTSTLWQHLVQDIW